MFERFIAKIILEPILNKLTTKYAEAYSNNYGANFPPEFEADIRNVAQMIGLGYILIVISVPMMILSLSTPFLLLLFIPGLIIGIMLVKKSKKDIKNIEYLIEQNFES